MLRNDIPLFEFDCNPKSVLMPDHEQLDMQLPKKAVFAFLYDAVDRYAAESHAAIVGEFVSATKNYPVYVTEYKGEEVCMMQAPVGAPAAVQIMDWMIGYGVETVISAGSCGTLRSIAENRFLVPTKALRDEGTSFHYAPPSRLIDLNPKAVKAIECSLKMNGFSYEEVTTWTTDGFFRETAEKVKARAAEGCSAVEMECSALAACAQMRNAIFGGVLYTADSLADILEYDARDFGEKSREIALRVCLDAAVLIGKDDGAE